MHNVILFSGGRTSGFMLKKLLALHGDSIRHPRACDHEWIVIFCNTGKERTETLDFVHEVETRWKVPIVWLEYHRVMASSIAPGVFPTPKRNINLQNSANKGETTHWFKLVNYESASRKGEPFDELLEWMSVLPNVVSRGCSMQLKIRTAMRYLFSLGLKEYCPIIGIRRDEEQRATQILSNCDSFEHPKFPLIEMGVSESDVMEFWEKNDFDLRLESHEGNCDLCFLKAKWKRMLLIKQHPGMVDWWKGWEKKKSDGCGNGKYFRLGEPYEQLESIVNNRLQQSELFEGCFVGNKVNDIPCSCAERGFEPEDDDSTPQ